MSASTHDVPVGLMCLAKQELEGSRIVDVLIAAWLLLLLMPLMFVIALLIWAQDGGTVFFSQTRLGHHGRPFKLYKFRKFRSAGEQAGPQLTLRRDRRMTRIGRLLERTKMDELPQIWNILVGDMSIVGPRPELMAFSDCYRAPYDALLRFRPGIFGPCQSIFRNESAYFGASLDPEELYRAVIFPLKAGIDLSYYPRRTWASDMAWAGRSILAVLGWSLLPDGAAHDLHELNVWVRNTGRLAT